MRIKSKQIKDVGLPNGIVPLNSFGVIDDQYINIQTLAKGDINVNTDFPLIADVQPYWWYHIAANVTDNAGVTYTNTGLSFVAGDEIYWDGTTWQPYGNLQTTDRQPTILVTKEKITDIASGTSLEEAFNTLKASNGGSIVFGADIVLTKSWTFDHSGIRIYGNGKRLNFVDFNITISSRNCYYENVLFNGNAHTNNTQNIFKLNNAVYGTSLFTFQNCRFYDVLDGSNYATVGVIDTNGFAGSCHITMNNCIVDSYGGRTINDKSFNVKLYGNTSSASSLTISMNRSSGAITQSNLFGFIGTLYDSGNNFITDGSVIYSGIALGGSDKNYVVVDYPLISTKTELLSKDNNDYVLVYDVSANALKKMLVSTLTGTGTFDTLSDVNMAAKTDKDFIIWDATSGKYIPYNPGTLSKEPTGFTNNENITVTYDSVNRTVTLTGTFEAYFNGKKVAILTNGWTSAAHANVNGTYYLRYDGTNFVFDTTVWNFYDIQIAFVQYQTAYKIALKETHGFMQYQVHDELHNTIGTYLGSGGDLQSYTLLSTTAANRRPDLTATVIKDEDNPTLLPALSTKLYTQRYLTSTGTKNYTTGASDIIALSGNQPYYNQLTGGNWVQTLFANNEYGAIFVVALPCTSDSGSQTYRYMFVQPQTVSTDLAVIQALQSTSLVHGDPAALLSEFCFIGKIIIRYTTGNWYIQQVDKLTGTRLTQTSANAGTYLSAVTTDTSLTGLGTVASPLSVNCWRNVQGTPTRVSGTQFTITDTSNTLKLDKLYCKKTILKWTDSGNTKMACVYSASYATNTVTVNIYGDTLNVGFTDMKSYVVKCNEISFSYDGLISAADTSVTRTYYTTDESKYFFIEANLTAGSGGTGSTIFALKSAGVTISALSFATADTNKVSTITDGTIIAANSKLTLDITAVLTSPTTFHSNVGFTIYTIPYNIIYLS